MSAANGQITTAVSPLGPAGDYHIGYRVVSDDGHPVTGKVSFTLTAPGPGGALPTPSAVLPSAAAPAPVPDPVTVAVDPQADTQQSEGAPIWPWLVGAVVLVGAGAAVALRLGRQTPVRREPVVTEERRWTATVTTAGRPGSPRRPGPGSRSAPPWWPPCSPVRCASTTLPALLGTGITRVATDVAGVTCVGLALVGVLLPRRSRATSRARPAASARWSTARSSRPVARGWWWRCSGSRSGPPTATAARSRR